MKEKLRNFKFNSQADAWSAYSLELADIGIKHDLEDIDFDFWLEEFIRDTQYDYVYVNCLVDSIWPYGIYLRDYFEKQKQYAKRWTKSEFHLIRRFADDLKYFQ